MRSHELWGVSNNLIRLWISSEGPAEVEVGSEVPTMAPLGDGGLSGASNWLRKVKHTH